MCIFFLFTPAFLGNSFSMNSGVCQALPLRAVWESLICSFVQQRFCGQCGEWDRGTYWGEVGGRPPLLPSWGTLEVLGSGRLGINQGLWPPPCQSEGGTGLWCLGFRSVAPAAFSCVSIVTPISFSLWNACLLMFLSFHFSARQLSFPSKDTIPMLIILQNSPDFFLSFKPKYQLLSFVLTVLT